MSRLYSVLMDRTIRSITALIAIVLIAAIPTQAAFAAQSLTSVSVGSQSGTLTYGTAGSATYTITVVCTGANPRNNSVSVALSVSGLPTGVTSGGFSTNPVVFNNNTCSTTGTSQTSTLTLNMTTSAAPGSTTFTVTGDAGGGSTQSGSGTLLIGTRPITVTAVTNTKVYDGTTSAAATPTLALGTLAAGDTGNYTETYSTATAGAGKTLVPSATITKGGTDVTAYYNITLTSNTTGVIDKADAVITVNGYSGEYDGSAHGASGSATGVEAVPANLNSLLHLGATFTNVPGGTAHWTFDGDTNYNAASGDVAVVLSKADATISVTPYTVTYDGTAHSAAGTATGVLDESLAGLNLSGTSHTSAGDFASDPWTFADVTGNYNNDSGTVHDSIAKADATITVTPYNVTYDSTAHTATGTATGVQDESLGGLDLANTTHTDSGDYPADGWTFIDATGNYNNASGTVHDSIAKAAATVTLGSLSQTYNGTPRVVSATTNPVGLTVVFAYDSGATAPTNAGSYAVTATVSDPNYTGSDSGTLVVAKADATCTITGYTGAYDTLSHGATGTCSGIGGETPGTVDLGETYANVPGGTAHWSFTGNSNYNNQTGTADITITPVDASCTVSGYSGAYTATAHGASGSCTGVGGADVSAALNLGQTYTNVPGGKADWSFSGNNNYNAQSGSVDITLTPIDASCSIVGYAGVYDAAAHGASGTCSGINSEAAGTVSLGDSFTNVPGGTAHWSLTGNDNYNDASGDVSVAISKADASCSVNGYTGTYDSAAHGAIGSCSGVGGETAGTLDLGSSFTDVPGGTAHWTLTGNGNFNNQSGDASIILNAATPTIHITGGTFDYDGLPHPASATATGVLGATVSGDFSFQYNGLSTVPVAAGSYDVIASFASSNTNYANNSASCPACIVIGPANEPPTFTSTAVTKAKVGTLYTYHITASDPEHDALTITAVTPLPTWLALTDHHNGTATLTGTPALTNMGSRLIKLGVSDGHLTAYQSFTLNPEATVTVRSHMTHDGWVLEKSETSNTGGSMNSTAATFNLGDDKLDRQYRGLLSFNTGSLKIPPRAIVTQMTLKIKQSGKPVGTSPFLSLGNILVDVKRGTFGMPGLQLTDFQQSIVTGTGRLSAMQFKNTPVGGWYSATLTGTVPNTLIYRTGNTQFRLRFSKDDNDNHLANYLMFFSGNSLLANRPVLVITYHLP